MSARGSCSPPPAPPASPWHRWLLPSRDTAHLRSRGAGPQDHRTAGSPGLGGTRRDRPGLGPASGTGLGVSLGRDTERALQHLPCPRRREGGKGHPRPPQVPLRLLRPPPLIPDPDSAVAQWKFCPFCEFSSRPAVPRCLAQAAALSSPEIVRKEHPWHGNEAAGAGPVSAAPGDAAHVALE